MTKRTFEIIAFFAAVLVAGMALHAWLASRNEQQRLQSTLATQKKLLDAASARESGRNTTLAGALAQIAALKRAVQTPQQIVRDLPKYLSLPQPITLTGLPVNHVPNRNVPASPKIAKPIAASAPQKGTGVNESAISAAQAPAEDVSPDPSQNSLPSAITDSTASCDSPTGCSAEIPPADLKPLYDYVQDCRACQAEIAVAKQNAADDAVKISALTSERDAAITAAKGGTFWRRLRRNAMWFAIGATAGSAAGFVAAKR